MNTPQKKSFPKGAFLLLCLLAGLSTSCIDQRYDLNKKISMKMAIGGDSLSIPLASTDSIMIGDILDADSIEMLMQDSNGYKITMKDTLTVEIPKIDASQLSIEDQTFPIDTTIVFMDAGDIEFSVPETKQHIPINMGMNNVSVESFEIPDVSMNQIYAAGVSGLNLTESQKTISMDPITSNQSNFLKSAEDFANNIHVEIPLPLPDVNINLGQEYNIAIAAPNDVDSVYDINLQKTPNHPTLQITMSMNGAADLFTSGSINPEMLISAGDLFVFENVGNIQYIGEGDVLPEGSYISLFGELNKENNFSQSQTVYIDYLNIDRAPQDGAININDSIKIFGTAAVRELMCYADQIGQVVDISLQIEVRLNDMVIESMTFKVPSENTASQISGNTTFNFSNELDERITSIDSILLEQGSIIVFNLNAQNISGLNGNITLDHFQLVFPDEFIIEPLTGYNAATHTYEIQNEVFDVINGKRIAFHVIGFDMSNHPVNNHEISWNDEITYSGEYSIGGILSSNDIPSGNNAGIHLNVTSDMAVDYACITTDDISVELPTTQSTIRFEVNLSDQVDSIGSAKVKDGSFLRIHFNLPELPLTLNGDMEIHFPKLIEFAGNPVGLDKSTNIYTINGEIPDSVSLEIDYIHIDKKLNEGYINVLDSVMVSGNLTLLSGSVNSSILQEKMNASSSVDVNLDKMVLSDIGIDLNGIGVEMHKSMAFQTSIEIPDLVKAIDSITINRATLSISIDVDNMPDLGDSPLILDFRINLPDKFIVEGENITNNVWRFRDTLKNESDINEEIYLKGLSFAGETLGTTYDLDENIVYDISITANDPEINTSTLSPDPVHIVANVALTGIKVNGVYGIVDPQIDPVSQAIALEGLPDMLKDTSIVLDIQPIIAMNAKTNIGIPIEIEGLLIPVIDGKRATERQQNISLSIEKSPSPKNVLDNKFWLAESNAGMPDDYSFVKLDVGEVFATIPDSVIFEVVAGTDQNQQHEFLLDEAYVFDLDYDVTIPLSLGEDFRLSIKDTLDLDLDMNMDSMSIEFGDYIEIYGNITNSIPLELNVTLTPIDEMGDIIPLENVISQKIGAGNSDGSASVSALSIKVANEKELLNRLSGFIIEFSVSSNATIAGTPLRPSNFVKADLGIRAVGGIVVDLDNE